jgi:hypothetical protein
MPRAELKDTKSVRCGFHNFLGEILYVNTLLHILSDV